MSHLASARISGRFSATPAELKAALTTLANGVNGVPADVIRLTEVGSPAHRQAIVEWARMNNFWVHQARRRGYGECVILGRMSCTACLARAALLTTDLELRTARDAPLVVAAAAVQHNDTGHVVLVADMHTPAHVSTPRGLARNWPGKVHRAMTRGAARSLRQWRKSLPPGIRRRIVGRSYAADWNITLTLAWAVTYLRTRWPGLRVAANRLQPTHKGRPIDAELTDLPTSLATQVVGRLKGFDHLWTFTVYDLPTKETP